MPRNDLFPSYTDCENIAKEIISGLSDRKGIGDEIGMVDDDILTEIIEDITETIFSRVRNPI